MIFIQNYPVTVKKFSDGAVQVSFSEDIMDLFDSEEARSKNFELIVTANIKSAEDLLALVQTKALVDSNLYDHTTILNLPYTPYQRSDRMMGFYSCGGLKAIAPIINSLKFDCVYVDDPHSDVVEGVLDNVTVHDLEILFEDFKEHSDLVKDIDYLISPDSGAFKKVLALGTALGIPVIEAGKIRQLHTNKILRTVVREDGADLTGKRVLIVDDICEYGTTHRELAAVLKDAHNVSEVNLYVSHGVFPNNLREEPPSRFSFPLGQIDNIYAYHMWGTRDERFPEKVHYQNLFE